MTIFLKWISLNVAMTEWALVAITKTDTIKSNFLYKLFNTKSLPKMIMTFIPYDSYDMSHTQILSGYTLGSVNSKTYLKGIWK